MAIRPVEKANFDDVKQTPKEEREQLQKELAETEEQKLKREKCQKLDR